MLSIQEMRDKTETTRKDVERMLDHGYYDYSEVNIFGKGSSNIQESKPLGQADNAAILESLRGIPLKEFLAKSSTTGIMGAAYLIPDKIYQILFDSAVQADITADISIAMIPPDQIPGATMKVDVAIDESYKPIVYSSGGIMPDQEIKVKQPTLDFTAPFGIKFRIGNDLIEDSAFDLIELHIRNAGREMGEFATNLALTVLKTATDGDGAVNGGLSGDGDETRFAGATTTDLIDLHNQITDDGYFPNRLILTPQAWWHNIVTTVLLNTATPTYGLYSEPWAYNTIVDGMAKRLLGCDVTYRTDAALHLSTDEAGTFTDCVSIMFDSQFALLSGRKRWLRIENFSDPIRDLVGATVTARQDSVTIYNDSIGVITET